MSWNGNSAIKENGLLKKMDYITQKPKASSEYYEFYMKNCAVSSYKATDFFFTNSNQYAVGKKYLIATVAMVTHK